MLGIRDGIFEVGRLRDVLSDVVKVDELRDTVEHLGTFKIELRSTRQFVRLTFDLSIG